MRATAAFFVVAFGGISSLAGLVTLAGERGGPWLQVGLSAMAMFMPLLGVLVAQRLGGEPLLRGIGAKPVFNRWLFVASGLGLLIAALTVPASLLLPGTQLDPSGLAILDRLPATLSEAERAAAEAQLRALPPFWWLLTVPQIVLAGGSINALFAFGEEIGWRGWLRERAIGLGFWRSHLVIGAVWGVWHTPLVLLGHNYPQHPHAGAFLFPIVCVLMAPLHGLVREKGGSVWHAAVLHGTINAGAGIAPALLRGGDDLTVGLAGLSGVIALLGVNLLVLPWTWRLELRPTT